MLTPKSLTLALGAIAIATTAMTATAGSWPNNPVRKPATANKPAATQVATSEAAPAREAIAAGDFEFIGGESGWQLRQHRYTLRSGSFAHAPDCTLAASARAAATPAPGRKASEPADIQLPSA